MITQTVTVDGVELSGIRLVEIHNKISDDYGTASITVSNRDGRFTDQWTMASLLFKKVAITIDGTLRWSGFVIDVPQSIQPETETLTLNCADDLFQFKRKIVDEYTCLSTYHVHGKKEHDDMEIGETYKDITGIVNAVTSDTVTDTGKLWTVDAWKTTNGYQLQVIKNKNVLPASVTFENEADGEIYVGGTIADMYTAEDGSVCWMSGIEGETERGLANECYMQIAWNLKGIVPSRDLEMWGIRLKVTIPYTNGNTVDGLKKGALWVYNYRTTAWSAIDTAVTGGLSSTYYKLATGTDIWDFADSTADTNEAVDATETDIDTTDGTKFAAGDYIKIDDEIMLVSAVNVNTITVTRGTCSTQAATHLTATSIYLESPYIDYDNGNEIKIRIYSGNTGYFVIFGWVIYSNIQVHVAHIATSPKSSVNLNYNVSSNTAATLTLDTADMDDDVQVGDYYALAYRTDLVLKEIIQAYDAWQAITVTGGTSDVDTGTKYMTYRWVQCAASKIIQEIAEYESAELFIDENHALHYKLPGSISAAFVLNTAETNIAVLQPAFMGNQVRTKVRVIWKGGFEDVESNPNSFPDSEEIITVGEIINAAGAKILAQSYLSVATSISEPVIVVGPLLALIEHRLLTGTTLSIPQRGISAQTYILTEVTYSNNQERFMISALLSKSGSKIKKFFNQHKSANALETRLNTLENPTRDPTGRVMEHVIPHAHGGVEDAGNILKPAQLSISDETDGITFRINSNVVECQLKDDMAAALDIMEGANSYLKFVTTNAAEKITFGKAPEYAADPGGNDILTRKSYVDGLNTTVLAHLMVGVANAAYVPCVYEGSNVAALCEIYPSFANAGATDFSMWFCVPLPSSRGGKKLYINELELGIVDADDDDYVTEIRLYGVTEAAQVALYTSATDQKTPGVKTYTPVAAIDCSGYDRLTVWISVVATTAYEFELYYVKAKCYYDT